MSVEGGVSSVGGRGYHFHQVSGLRCQISGFCFQVSKILFSQGGSHMFKVSNGFEIGCVLSSDGGCANRCRRTKGDAFRKGSDRKYFDCCWHRS